MSSLVVGTSMVGASTVEGWRAPVVAAAPESAAVAAGMQTVVRARTPAAISVSAGNRRWDICASLDRKLVVGNAHASVAFLSQD